VGGRVARRIAPIVAPLVALAFVLATTPRAAHAQQPAASLVGKKILIVGFDALGMDPGKVERLEALFRVELERLAGGPSPSRRELARALAKAPPALRSCSGEARCLAAIGKKLGVDLVVTGNVGELGESYVVNIKVVDAATGAELRRIASDPLRGAPDDLIEAVRVAAYRLLAPDELHGAISLLVDLPGAAIELDGRRIGAAPLARPLARLALGPHRLAVSARGYTRFEEDVVVRFQKTSRVVVRLALATGGPAPLAVPIVRREARPWYGTTWGMVGIGAGAVLVGALVGAAIAKDDVLDCGASPERCQ
jgi:hypothetical protein